MGQVVPNQHPAVVLRSQFNQLRALLAVALIAVAGLTIAVVIVAGDGDEAGGTSGTSTIHPVGRINYGEFNPTTGRPESAPLPQQEHSLRSTLSQPRYDGGPEEGTRGIERSAPVPEIQVNPSTGYPTTRYDGGPEEGTRDIVASSSALVSRYDGGPEEGSWSSAVRPD